MNAQLSFTESRQAQLSANVTFTGASGTTFSQAIGLSAREQVEASISLEESEGDLEVWEKASIFVVVYNRAGCMVSVESWEVDLSDPSFLFTRMIRIPDNAEVGAIKILGMSEDMVPLMKACGIGS